jgi:hypothetical protein
MTLAYTSYAKLQILRHRFVQEAFILALFLIGLPLVLTSLVADPLSFWKFWITLYTPVYACVVTIVLIVLSAYLVQLVGKRSGTIARNLLTSYQGDTEDRYEVDHMACLALLFFLSTIFTTLGRYANFYDSDNTHMPKWTGVFG